MSERWSVEIERHEPPATKDGYERSVQELKIFLNAEQVALVHKAVLATLAANVAKVAIAEQVAE